MLLPKELTPYCKDGVTVAFSGGPDSRALLDLLIREEVKVRVAYVNHMLRGEESIDEEAFVTDLVVNKLGLELLVKRVDLHSLSRDRKIGLEEAGREARYQFFESIGGVVATAHNLDDNVETFIFRLLRGSSFNGLKSIPQVRGRYIRPLLEFSKREILEYIKKNNLEYFTDSSNDKSIFTRNLIRREIFPLFERVNPKFREKINHLIDDIKSMKFPELEKILVKEPNMSRRKIEMARSILSRSGSCSLDLSKDRVLVKSYDSIYIKDRVATPSLSVTLNLDSRVAFLDGYIKFERVDDILNMSRDIFYVDLDRVGTTLEVRQRRAGDSIYIEGLGSKKLKKLFIDMKIDRFERDRIPIISLNNEPVWIAGVRGSDRYRAIKGGNVGRLSFCKKGYLC